jgi:hypothetical protein
MKLVRYAVIALFATAAFAGCKKGHGGYLRTAPQPAASVAR